MSFLSSMQQYVTSGISSLGLGNRRFSLSKQDANENQQQTSQTQNQLMAGTPLPTPNLQQTTGPGSTASNIFNVVAPTVGSGPAQGQMGNYPSGGVVIGNPNATNPLLGK